MTCSIHVLCLPPLLYFPSLSPPPFSSPPSPLPSLPSPVFLCRLSTASCADSLASFNMAASEQDPSAGGGKGYDFAPYIDLYSPYTYKLALQYMPSCLERPKVPQAPSVWCVDMHEDVIVVGCGNGHVEVRERGGAEWRGSEVMV